MLSGMLLEAEWDKSHEKAGSLEALESRFLILLANPSHQWEIYVIWSFRCDWYIRADFRSILGICENISEKSCNALAPACVYLCGPGNATLTSSTLTTDS